MSKNSSISNNLDVKTVPFQTIPFSISTLFKCPKTVLFQTIQLSISTQFSAIWLIDWTISVATNPGQSGPGSDGNEGVLCIPQSANITGTSQSDCLVSYSGHLLGGVSPLCREAVGVLCIGWVLPLRRKAASVFYSPNRQGKLDSVQKIKLLRNNYAKNVNNNIQWTLFPNL